MVFPKEQLLFCSPECISLSPWQAEKMFSVVQDALNSRLDQVEWMDEQTRQEAKDKACVEDTGHWVLTSQKPLEKGWVSAPAHTLTCVLMHMILHGHFYTYLLNTSRWIHIYHHMHMVIH
ncbi:Kell blood group, metallo-endopeptidase [Platysternon megacephalum]|uniref:Kell blood group, metallo-endopeptidase n=1 Tax=Platysternon megacephalum TaxID=55544 RepID=A0A4D9DS06_9SAUR|nr:Kell blood group, metallo-endopeptidase [Platysternon megacephalum]